MNDSTSFADDSADFKEHKDFKLPKIQRLPSRGFHKEIRSNTKLPNIKNEANGQCRQVGTQRIVISEDDDFVGQVQRRLKLIMEQQNIIEIDEGCQSDGEAFEKKIIENKEIIKQARRKNEIYRKQNEQFYRNGNFGRKVSHKNKNQVYQKRFRQNKQGSIENRYHQKPNKKAVNKDLKEAKNIALKEYVSNKQINIREVKSKDELIYISKLFPNQHKIDQKQLKKQYSQKHITSSQKNQQLFDAIHNYLQNPKRHEVQVISPEKIKKQRAQLQEQLRECQERLQSVQESIPQKQSIKSEENQNIIQSDINNTVTNWKKVGINLRGLFAQQYSSFDKQVDRIDHFLKKNEKSLQKYVLNQKMMVDMQMVSRKKSPKTNEQQLSL